MTIKLNELEWHEGHPGTLRAGMLLDEGDSGWTLVGHVNEETGGCGCCGGPIKAVRWAMLELVP